jgi:hypothetical protein
MRRGCDRWLETAADDAVMAIMLALPRRPSFRPHTCNIKHSNLMLLLGAAHASSLQARERSRRVRSRAGWVLLLKFEPTPFRASGERRLLKTTPPEGMGCT